MYKWILFLLVFSLPVFAQPTGIFSLNRVVDAPYVDGYAVRVKWREMEPVKDQFDFSKIEEAIQQVEAVNQKLTLAVLVADEPAWLLEEVEEYQNGPHLHVVPFDDYLISRVQRLAQKMSRFRVNGVMLKVHPTISQVSSPIAGVQSLRLWDTPPGYTPELFIETAKRNVNIWSKAFPGKDHYIGIFGIEDGTSNPSTVEVARDELRASFPRLYFFQELLTGNAPVLESNLAKLVLPLDTVMYQACGPWALQDTTYWSRCNWVEPIDTPQLGIIHGNQDFGSTYFEFYPQDLEEPAYAAELQQWHDILAQ